MRVKIGERWHDATDVPIAIELSDGERDQIAAMEPGTRIYTQYPTGLDQAAIARWMKHGSALEGTT